MKYQTFIFENYYFDVPAKTVTFHYSLDSILKFTETYTFDFDYVSFDARILDHALQNLFFMAGVSYYKTYLPPEISIKTGQLDRAAAEFFGKTYQKGLGEFFYVNQLDPNTKVTFPANVSSLPDISVTTRSEGLLVAIGGGKDSLVSVEILKEHTDTVATWSLSHKAQLGPLVDKIGLPHYWVEREWDKQLLAINDDPQSYNGHVPISAIIACVGTVLAVLTGKRDVVVSNEQSTNEPMLHYQGIAINHQYSKSQEFEQDFQSQLQRSTCDAVRYYSFLRPLSEVHIAELFARSGFQKYHDVFSSCNKAFVHTSSGLFWDGTCPKCAFVFLALTPFVPRDQLEALFSGRNLLLDPALEPTYQQLLGIQGDRPLECVGTVQESRAAMTLAKAQYPELSDYVYELPADYDYRKLWPHSMPEAFYTVLKKHI